MIIAMAILGLVIGVTASLYRTFNRMWAQMNEKSRLHQALQFSMEQLTAEMRETKNITQLGPVTLAAGVTVASADCTIDGPATVQAMPLTTIHLDAATNQSLVFTVPNLKDPLNLNADTKIILFMQDEPKTIFGQPITMRRLYQQMVYYNGYRPPPVPLTVNIDRYRQDGILGAATPVALASPWPVASNNGYPEPAGGVQYTPTASVANTPTPVVPAQGTSIRSMGRMSGAYQTKDFSFDDVAFYWDPFNKLIGISLTASIQSASLSTQAGKPQDRRRRESLSTTITFRRTEGVAVCP